MTVLRAWRDLQRIRRELAHLAELPQAQHMALVCNMNRDPKKSSKPFGIEDFALFKPNSEKRETFLSPDGASALISLQQDGLLHPMLLACWREALENSTPDAPPPAVRAFRDDAESVWVIAPEWEGAAVRALVCVTDYLHGPVVLRDVDRPLNTYTFTLPRRAHAGAGWIEAGHLLLPAT